MEAKSCIKGAPSLAAQAEREAVFDGTDETEDLLPVSISMRFRWEENFRRNFEVPRLTGVWMKGYGWLLGGSQSYTDEIKVETAIMLPRPIATAILENNYDRHNLLPKGRP